MYNNLQEVELAQLEGESRAQGTQEANQTPQFIAELENADSGWRKYVNLANISNLVTFLVMILGLVLELGFADKSCGKQCFSRYVLSFGLFGFSGGITNWLAITMLFDKIPYVYGSGIIPQQFEEIKRTIASMIMDTFFEPSFLRRQLTTRVKDLGNNEQVRKTVKDMFESDAFDDMLDKKLENMQESKGFGGTIMKAFNIQSTALKPTLKKFIISLASDLTTVFLGAFDPVTFFDDAAVAKMRTQIEAIIEDRLRELTAEKVKFLMEAVIRVHLGWLVVWGNVFGALIGVICTAVGY
eukprot:c7539_g1_i1.p1 GENE.c7539_g1_i1~~c7539_g1_i1.p1  ORF type:complete len:307 (-),score=52.26 c7539_g1_i1:668-1561(-)